MDPTKGSDEALGNVCVNPGEKRSTDLLDLLGKERTALNDGLQPIGSAAAQCSLKGGRCSLSVACVAAWRRRWLPEM